MNETQQVERSEQHAPIPPLPPWPTSRPGPRITEPPAGQRRLRSRTEQVVEIGYDAAQGKSLVRQEEE